MGRRYRINLQNVRLRPSLQDHDALREAGNNAIPSNPARLNESGYEDSKWRKMRCQKFLVFFIVCNIKLNEGIPLAFIPKEHYGFDKWRAGGFDDVGQFFVF
ncbi:hypothetical protein CDAR_292371 [Caerostris darwini]|uniref:Uncharacterized protein n=1 Tax=Caerostris darwini TaxID=1538125 RepID=A0AAV4UCU7_9ARAC|nr:hypothetical protein CDAR_292371 [Caerostris darwini]